MGLSSSKIEAALIAEGAHPSVSVVRHKQRGKPWYQIVSPDILAGTVIAMREDCTDLKLSDPIEEWIGCYNRERKASSL
ncbi:hypothetical protein P11VFA_041 [Rhizobium phage P11VFA]|nr:hypothetical protein P11VFA_041 [Rhizobium phage P11VFA]